MIPGPCDPHWLTLFDDDGEPFGETCCCEIDADHAEVMTEFVALILASELARLADEIYDEAEGTYGGFLDGIGVAVDIVRRRASELRGEGQSWPK